jgi:phosphatidylinositol-3-phosphatase
VKPRHLFAFVVALFLTALTSCGSSGSRSYIPSSPTINSIKVACAPSTIATNATSQCTATVQGTASYSSTVKWSTSSGTISSSGLLTAPSSIGNLTVTATSTEDTTKSGAASVAVQSTTSPPAITSVSVACAPSTIAPNATSQCIATVQGTGSYSSAVTWSSNLGEITATGLLTALAAVGSVTVTATSVQDPTRFGEATLTVQLVTPQSKHIVVVMEENSSYSTVVDSGQWPNLNSLIKTGALPTNYYADTHPSIGNYLMLTTGQILTNDDSSTQVWNVDNVARRMLASGVSFRVYAEGITQGYVGGNTGLYLIRHNPFALLSDVADNATVANQVICPITQFATDLANNALPEFSFIVPDVNDDAHNGTPQQADSWLQTNVVVPLSSYSAFAAGGDGLLIVDFDEAATSDTDHGGGHVSPVLWGPIVRVGYTQASTTIYQHESMLRTIMEGLGLSDPPGAAASAPSMSEFFVQP